MVLIGKHFNRLYIHVPFCAAKCAYCAFYSISGADSALIDQWLDRLRTDMDENAATCHSLKSIFIGGGTPSILSPRQLKRLFDMIRDHFTLAPTAEITMEANPESLTDEIAETAAGFCNRVSVGIQSIRRDHRRTIGRIGDEIDIRKITKRLNDHGLENVGVDLIYGIPGQTLDNWLEDLERIATLPIKHLSAYALTYEEGTRLSENSNTKPLSDELVADMWEAGGDVLSEHGLNRYEISNYARKGFECSHNLEIWYGDTYLGLGPAASSFDGDKRRTQSSDLIKWLDDEPAEIDELPTESRAKEIFVFGLRTTMGWTSPRTDQFVARTGLHWKNWLKTLDLSLLSDHIIIDDNSIRLTKTGLLLWDEIASAII